MGHAFLFGFISTGGSQLLVSSWPIELDRYVTIMHKEDQGLVLKLKQTLELKGFLRI